MKNLHEVDCCANCKHVKSLYDWDEPIDCFCTYGLGYIPHHPLEHPLITGEERNNIDEWTPEQEKAYDDNTTAWYKFADERSIDKPWFTCDDHERAEG